MSTSQATVTRYIGIDAGGTQFSALSNLFPDEPLRFDSRERTSLETSVMHTIGNFGSAETIVIGAAGPVDSTGCVKLTNCPHYPVFDPNKLGTELGSKIVVVNDMVIKAAGIVNAQVEQVVEGHTDPTGPAVIITVSTGVGIAVRLPDGRILSSEGGHPTWQPANMTEFMVLEAIRQKLGSRYVSTEQLIGGKHLRNLYDALLQSGFMPETDVRRAAESCRLAGKDIGPVITANALEGESFCVLLMDIMGSVLGQFLRNLGVTFMPTGGVYLTGGVMQPEVVQYLFNERAPLFAAYLGGTEHNSWLQNIPINLVTDKDLGVKGALQLAMQQS